jgi:hypothetical protein
VGKVLRYARTKQVVNIVTTYLLAPRSRILLEKLTGSQLVKKFPAFYGARRFIIAFTSAREVIFLTALTEVKYKY